MTNKTTAEVRAAKTSGVIFNCVRVCETVGIWYVEVLASLCPDTSLSKVMSHVTCIGHETQRCSYETDGPWEVSGEATAKCVNNCNT